MRSLFGSRRWAPVLLAVLLVGCSTAPDIRTTAAPTEPRNLTLLKEELAAYADSGQYERDLAAVAAEARAWVDTRAGRARRDEKLAIIFDLDETLLANLGHIRSQNFGYVPPVWDRWVAEARAPAIEPVAEVYRAAVRHGVTVFYITGRRGSQYEATEENLRRVGLSGHAALYCKPDDFAGTSEAFKTGVRQRLSSEGWVIIANVGDQQSDLDGGYAERTFKLPNPFYLTR